MNRRFSSRFSATLLAGLLLAVPPGNLPADSLWKQGTSRSIYEDKKARAVGDVITILIQENNGSSRQNNTTTSKKADINASIASFLYGPAASGLLTKSGSTRR